jgi:NCAIR mutase (PurE)-related protein
VNTLQVSEDVVRYWAKQLAEGSVTFDEFLLRVGHNRPVEKVEKSVELGPLTLDLDRKRRCGYPEVIFGEGKSIDVLLQAVSRLLQAGQSVLVTRLAADKAQVVLGHYPHGVYNAVGRTFRCLPSGDPQGPSRGRVAVVTAGTGDLPVAEEARETLLWMNVAVTTVHDVGVAGPHRLPERLDAIRDADAVVVVAGMEGALPSVVGGYVDCPVFAVPSSVGYGVSFHGLAALLSMLNSCAANVAVVNIDAGFKAAYLAGLVARRAAPRSA